MTVNLQPVAGFFWKESRAFNVALLGILLVAAAVRFYRISEASAWMDEAYSLALSDYSVSEIWRLSARDVHPPLYYLFLHGWLSIWGRDICAARSLSALSGWINVGLAIWLVRLVATPRAAIVAGLFVAVLPIAVRYSQEVRMYAWLGVWLTAATLALVYWLKTVKQQR